MLKSVFSISFIITGCKAAPAPKKDGAELSTCSHPLPIAKCKGVFASQTSLMSVLKQAFLDYDALTAENQAKLVKSLLEMSGLPGEIKASLSYLTQDLDALLLPYELILEIKEHLN